MSSLGDETNKNVYFLPVLVHYIDNIFHKQVAISKTHSECDRLQLYISAKLVYKILVVSLLPFG